MFTSCRLSNKHGVSGTGCYPRYKGTATCIILTFAVIISTLYLLPSGCDIIPSCGDINMNPGPSTPILNDTLLMKLQNQEEVVELPSFPLRFKHIHQLHELKKAGFSWDIVVSWQSGKHCQTRKDNVLWLFIEECVSQEWDFNFDT